MTITRFAPSPTGYLHLGHAFAAKTAFDYAQKNQGKFLLRFEDIDHTRTRKEYYQTIKDDLQWLGLPWDETPVHQLERLELYEAALDTLHNLGILYPCYCTRKDIQNLTNAPQGPEGPRYPGTCRHLPPRQGNPAWRIDSEKAAALIGPMSFTDEDHGTIPVDPLLLGDVVLARKDIATSYHLAVVVDDAAQQVTHVTRGKDLLPSTHVHRLLQTLLEFPEPHYHHHQLILNEQGERLAKRHGALAIRELRAQGHSPTDVLAMLC